jgi:hypothetical protein
MRAVTTEAKKVIFQPTNKGGENSKNITNATGTLNNFVAYNKKILIIEPCNKLLIQQRIQVGKVHLCGVLEQKFTFACGSRVNHM